MLVTTEEASEHIIADLGQAKFLKINIFTVDMPLVSLRVCILYLVYLQSSKGELTELKLFFKNHLLVIAIKRHPYVQARQLL